MYYVGWIKSELVSVTSVMLPVDEEGRKMKEKQDKMTPPDIAVNAILNYARSLEVKETKATGKIEWVLN